MSASPLSAGKDAGCFMSPLEPKQRWTLGIGAALLALLLGAGFTFGSLAVPFAPGNWREAMALYAVSSFITAALLVFGLILTRTVLRLWAERSKEQLGARFKTKMVVGAMALSLLPIVFMFFVSYSLLNRTLGRWFPRPLEIASEETQKLLNDLGRGMLPRLHTLGDQAAQHAGETPEAFLEHSFANGLDAVWILDQNGNAVSGGVTCDNPPEVRDAQTCMVPGVLGKRLRVLQSGIEIWEAGNFTYSGARTPLNGSRGTSGYLLTACRSNATFLDRLNQIQAQTAQYYAEKQSLRALKRQMLLILLFF